MKIRPLMELSSEDRKIISTLTKNKKDTFLKMPLYYLSRYCESGQQKCQIIISNGDEIKNEIINEDYIPVEFTDHGESFIIVQKSILLKIVETEKIIYVSYNCKGDK